jgi:pSer/pThr/pTyr-binding forkhead associated (FHA) protein
VNQLAAVPQQGFAITVLNGAERGVTYQLMAGKISIGRNDDNNIIIKDDPKISRNHAVITVTSAGAEISDVSGRNKVLVGESEVKNQFLRPGDIIQLGATKFQFKVLSDSSDMQLMGRLSELTKKRSTRSYRSKSGKLNFYIIVGVIGLLFAWLLTSKISQKNEVAIRTEGDVSTTITANQKIIADVEAEKTRNKTNTQQYEDAQPNYIKGFRDFRKGQYDRAIESFNACLSLLPEHPQCRRYKLLAQKKNDELIQYQMVLANKYRSQNQFAACRSAYKNVMVMVKNPGDKKYTEAKSGYDTCKALEGERF